jgi:predicted nucleic acid-binding protein
MPTNLTLSWARSRQVPDVVVPTSILGWDLGAGESQVLAQCLTGRHLAVLDDGEARAAARVHALPLVGTLGIILRARVAGLIPAARPLIEQLLESGSYLSADLVRVALAKVGE